LRRDLPNEWFRRIDIWTQCIEASPTITIAAPAPILHSITDQVHSHQQKQTPRHDLGEDLIQLLWRNHGHENLHPYGAKHTPQNRTPRIRTRELRPIICSWTSSILVSHGSVVECYREDIECWSYDRKQTGTNIEWGFGDVDTGYLHCCCDSGGDECG